jgi:hypothetical protein
VLLPAGARALALVLLCKQAMQPRSAPALALIPIMALALSGCAAVEGIFKAGVWVGVIAVAIVLAVAFGLVRVLNR